MEFHRKKWPPPLPSGERHPVGLLGVPFPHHHGDGQSARRGAGEVGRTKRGKRAGCRVEQQTTNKQTNKQQTNKQQTNKNNSNIRVVSQNITKSYSWVGWKALEGMLTYQDFKKRLGGSHWHPPSAKPWCHSDRSNF